MNITKGSVIKRGKRGQHVWSWKYQRNGVTQWETLNLPPGASKREAEILRDARLARCRDESISPGILSSLTINILSEKFTEHAERYYVKPNGRSTNEPVLIRSALAPLLKKYGTLKASELSPLKLKIVREDMIALGWKRVTINAHIGRIRRMFKWAVENELVSVTVLQSLQAVTGLKKGRTTAREYKKVGPVSLSHVEAAKPFLSTQVWAMIQLQLLTGARGGELCLLKPLHFDTSGKLWKARPDEHKTEHHEIARIIYFGPKAQTIVKKFMRDRPIDRYLFSPRESEAERHAKAESHRRPDQKANPRKTERTIGEHFTKDSYRRGIMRACEKAHIPPWTPHQLRHNTATVVRKQFGLDAAQVILGHSSANVTEVYAEADEARALDILMEIG